MKKRCIKRLPPRVQVGSNPQDKVRRYDFNAPPPQTSKLSKPLGLLLLKTEGPHFFFLGGGGGRVVWGQNFTVISFIHEVLK